MDQLVTNIDILQFGLLSMELSSQLKYGDGKFDEEMLTSWLVMIHFDEELCLIHW